MRNFYNLNGQDLSRHHIIESHFRNFGFDFVVSDSAKIHQLVEILFLPNSKMAFHFLELYSFSFTALLSEIKLRLSLCGLRPVSIAKTLITSSLAFFKVLLFRMILKKDSPIIISSDLRKNFLARVGFKNPIFVLRNKPVYSEFDIIKINSLNSERVKRIVLTGNLNNRTQFRILCRYIENMNITIYCYGISNSDMEWVAEEGFGNVVVLDPVRSDDIPQILKTSMYAICLYSESSCNQKYSASSKIFEILFWGAIPIVNSNQGLLSELNKLEAHYITIQDSMLEELCDNSLDFNLYNSRSCLFGSEIDNLNLSEFANTEVGPSKAEIIC